ncbi:MAG: YmdB family metallophosphoesterase, partial [bacterium]|nr:YmdB family metallophosphoesterase [bacterium]
MKVAFIGDVVGRAGRRTVARLIPEFKQKHSVDLTIANLENAAGGFGVT